MIVHLLKITLTVKPITITTVGRNENCMDKAECMCYEAWSKPIALLLMRRVSPLSTVCSTSPNEKPTEIVAASCHDPLLHAVALQERYDVITSMIMHAKNLVKFW
jgi:hypothetical protein